MSIAVSAIIKPSRVLAAMVLTMAVFASTVAILIGLGMIGDSISLPRLVIASLILFLSFFGFYHGMRRRKPIQLDISGIGQIRVTKWSSTDPCSDSKRPHVGAYGDEVQLLPESTLWPMMLLLRLQDANGRRVTVRVLPDSVSRDGFRALAVACKWIAANEVRSKANH